MGVTDTGVWIASHKQLVLCAYFLQSGYNPCQANVPQLVEAVKRGIMLAGALPVTFPTISLRESFAAPTSMYLRNLMSMDTEEMIRAQPMDAVVLIGGCEWDAVVKLTVQATRLFLPN